MTLHWVQNKLLIRKDEDYEWSHAEETARYASHPFSATMYRLFKPFNKKLRKEKED